MRIAEADIKRVGSGWRMDYVKWNSGGKMRKVWGSGCWVCEIGFRRFLNKFVGLGGIDSITLSLHTTKSKNRVECLVIGGMVYGYPELVLGSGQKVSVEGVSDSRLNKLAGKTLWLQVEY